LVVVGGAVQCAFDDMLSPLGVTRPECLMTGWLDHDDGAIEAAIDSVISAKL
jgi:hypothetical protein